MAVWPVEEDVLGVFHVRQIAYHLFRRLSDFFSNSFGLGMPRGQLVGKGSFLEDSTKGNRQCDEQDNLYGSI